MKDRKIPELAILYMGNIGTLQEIRSSSDREMANFLLDIKNYCFQKNVLRVEGNFRIDQFERDPETAQKRGLLTSDFARLSTPIRYKKNNRYIRVADLKIKICCGLFGLSPSQFHWVVYTTTTSKWGCDFDETLQEIAKQDTGSRFYNTIRKIDEDTLLFHSIPVSKELSVEEAVNDIQAVADFIYKSDPIFADKWKDQDIMDTEAEESENESDEETFHQNKDNG